MDKKEISKIGRKTFSFAQNKTIPFATYIRNERHQKLLPVAHLIRWGDGDIPEETQIIGLKFKDSPNVDKLITDTLRIAGEKIKANAVILVKEGVIHIISKDIIGDIPVAICWFETANGETHTWTSFMPDGKIETWDCDSKIMSECLYRGIVDKNYVDPAVTGAG